MAKTIDIIDGSWILVAGFYSRCIPQDSASYRASSIDLVKASDLRLPLFGIQIYATLRSALSKFVDHCLVYFLFDYAFVRFREINQRNEGI